MKKSEYEFVYQSRLQRFCYILSIIAGIFIGMAPGAVISHYIEYFDSKWEIPDTLFWVVGGLSFALLLALPILGIVMGAKIGMRWISHGTLQLYKDHAALQYGGKTVQLERKEFCVKTGMTSGRNHDPQEYFDIRMDGKKIRFYEAIISVRKPRYDASLNKAMMALMKSGLPDLPREIARALKSIRKRMKMAPVDNAARTLKIGEVQIYIRISTPEVFDNSPYYVDYSSCCATKTVPLCTCLVRERSDPEHVVGDIGFADDEDNDTPKPESELSKSVIVDGTALDERVGME